MSSTSRDSLHFSPSSRTFLEPHLPPLEASKYDSPTPFTTLTFATSLDSQLALAPGIQTALSGPQSKAMTHYLRSRHDAILIGVGTAIADNPSLNCRIEGVGGYGGEGLDSQPRPIIVDPQARWDFTSEHKIFQLVRQGRGRAPYIVTGLATYPADKKKLLEDHGGKFLTLKSTTTQSSNVSLEWQDILEALRQEGIRSVMVEGGGAVINSLLLPHSSCLIDSVIVTIAPTWLGRGGVVVSPDQQVDGRGNPLAALRLKSPVWHPFGEDVVLCGKVND